MSIYFQILFFNWGEGVDCEHEVFRLPLICISLHENRDLISTSLFEVLSHVKDEGIMKQGKCFLGNFHK